MLFKKYHIEMIKSGLKTETRRNWKKQMVKENRIYPVQIKMFEPKTLCPLIKVNYVFRQRLGDMSEIEAYKEGGYTLQEFKKIFSDINGYWDDNLNVYVIGFEYLKTEFKTAKEIIQEEVTYQKLVKSLREQFLNGK